MDNVYQRGRNGIARSRTLFVPFPLSLKKSRNRFTVDHAKKRTQKRAGKRGLLNGL